MSTPIRLEISNVDNLLDDIKTVYDRLTVKYGIAFTNLTLKEKIDIAISSYREVLGK